MNRDEAIATGNVHYDADKPCRRNHMGKRYTSTGNCVECLNIVTASRRAKIQRTRNAVAANDERAILLTIPLQWHELMNRIQDIALAGSTETMGLISSLVDSRVDQVARSDVRFALGLSRADLTEKFGMRLTHDGQSLQNIDSYEMTEYDPMHEIVYVKLGDAWYSGPKVMRVLKGIDLRVMPGDWETQT